MVWFHGGGFVNGSANNEEYTSIPLAQHGVVLVTVNHRLGMIGFLAHPLLSAESPKGVSGNYEFLDLIASLKWVQKNIAAFGGDPNNVTIFGQSGGGWKVTAMMTSPLAKGLFHRAIIESGAGLRGTPLSDLEKRGEKLFAMLGVSTLEDARALSWQTIIDTDNTLSAQEPLPAGWQAAVDGWVLPDTPENIFQAGQQNAVPLTVGAVLGELPTLGKLMNMIPYYEELFAGNYKVNTRSYAYIFNHVPAGWKQEGIASCHAMDLEYIFGVWDDLNTWVQLMPLAGATDPNPGLTDVDGKLSEEMMAMTTHFAKTGNPNVRGLVWWPAWDPATDKYLYITEVLEVESGFSEVGQ
jgi:para-nitrobenzyl esterase